MKNEDKENIDINTLAGGAIQESIKYGLEEIFENILDPNTDAEKVRKLTLTLEFRPDESRQVVKLKQSCKTSLCPTNAVTTQMLLGRNGEKIVASELLKHDPNQIAFDETGKLDNDKEIDERPNNIIEMNREVR